MAASHVTRGPMDAPAPSHNAAASRSPRPAKRSRSRLSFKSKMEIIRRLSAGETAASVSRTFGINESSVRTIAKNADRIKAAVANTSPSVVDVTWRTRNPLVTKTETVLADWIETRKPELSYQSVRARALDVYERLRRRFVYDVDETFVASKGWYHKFVKRLNNKTVCSPYPVRWDEVKSSGVEPHRTFVLHELALAWRRAPRVDIDDKCRLLLCSTVDGEFKCRPLVVFGKFAAELVQSWFVDSFCVEARDHCKSLKSDYKILLLLDNAPGYPIYLSSLDPDAKVLFLPMDVTLAMQPHRQSVVNAFKLRYLKALLHRIVERQSVSITNDDAMDDICKAWEETRIPVADSSWTKLCVEGLCSRTARKEPCEESLVSEVVDLCRLLADVDDSPITREEVVEFVESEDDEMMTATAGPTTTTKPPKIKTERIDYEEGYLAATVTMDDVNGDGVDEDKRHLTTIVAENEIDPSSMLKFFSTIEKMTSLALDVDPNVERSMEFAKLVRTFASVYKNIYLRK